MKPHENSGVVLQVPPHSTEAEQSVLGAILLQNDSIDRISGLEASHFYRSDHRTIYTELMRQILSGKTADVITLYESLLASGKAEDVGGLSYLNALAQNTPSAANIKRYADIVTDRATKRSLIAITSEMENLAYTSPVTSAELVDQAASSIDALAQSKVRGSPKRISESLSAYADLLTARMEGRVKPISTGFIDLDRRLDGGLERGTLTVIAGRPAMGKTAMGLCICRNVAEWGCSGFLSMEMSSDQVNDRNIAALGKLPISWLRLPTEEKEGDLQKWTQLSHAYRLANELNFYVDDETNLNMLDIRNKARQIKRQQGLDLLVIDQLSFITGGSKEKKGYELIGEYTRGLIGLAKQLNCAVILLCQLNRDCESRPNKRPQLSDLAMSGSIEQDASNVLFLYRDEVYNPDSKDKGVCEINSAKQRQGEPGTVALAYIASQTRFEDYSRSWEHPKLKPPAKARGFD